MPALSERSFISQFTVLPTQQIQVRKTTDILKDGAVVSTSHWRTVLEPHDPRAKEVLGAEPYYLALAEQAWAAQVEA